MIGIDNTGVSLAQQGFGAIQKQRDEQKAERQSRMPVPQVYADYIQRLLSDPNADPRALAQEARNHPEMRAFLQGGGQGGGGSQLPPPADNISHVGPGAGPGSPGLFTPQGTNPSPQSPMQGLPPRSLGDVQGAAHSGATGAVGYNPPSLAGGGGDGGAQFMHSARTQGGQPAPGPQMTAQQVGMQPTPQQPGGGNFVPRGEFPAPKFQGGDTMSYRDAAMIAPQLPGIQAAQSRERAAAQGGDTKLQIQEMKNNLGLAVAQMKKDGVDDATIVKMLLGTATIQGQQERFVEGEKGKTERAKIGAGATLGAADRRAGAAEDSDEKRLRNLETQIAGLKKVTDWETQPDLREMVGKFEAEADAAAQRLGKPRVGAKPQGGASTPAPKAPGAKGKGGKVQMKFPNGQTYPVAPDAVEAAKKKGGVIVNG